MSTVELSAAELRDLASDPSRLHALAERLEAEAASEPCTGLAASWCHRCGDCACPHPENELADPCCPLHAPSSRHAAPAPVIDAEQWGRPGDHTMCIPSRIARLLADADGTTYGYGHGPGSSTIFGSAQGDVTIQIGQWVARHADGSITVQDERPVVTGGPA